MMQFFKEKAASLLQPLTDRFRKEETADKTLEGPSHKPGKQLHDEQTIRRKAEALGIPFYSDFSSLTIDHSLTKKIPYSLVKKYFFLPLNETATAIFIATHDPFDLDLIEEVRMLSHKQVETILVSKSSILAAIHEFYHQEDASPEMAAQLSTSTEEDFQEGGVEIFDLLDSSQDLPPAMRLINFSVAEAIQQGASDIHFEPQESGLIIRYRIDGSLQTRLTPSQEVQSQLLTRLKVMAKLDIAERRLPQDGRIKMRLGGKTIDFRVSTIPTVTGERIVLRILDKGNIILGLDKIGMPDNLLQQFRSMIDFPEGIILVTGPTGSGKTTTLYSALTELKKDDTNIMTIEDPVEYRLKGIAQIGVQPKIGLSFSAGLRHILRQDPDIIMLGEIRDKETAEIAIQAALTGHLVLSTLHTNDAPSAIVRLVDMGIEPYLISSCVIGVLAQRLVRKICPACNTTYIASPQEAAYLNAKSATLHRGAGCAECLQSGFRGRHGIYELMPLNTSVRKQLLTSPEATQIQAVALKEGMKTLRDHGKQLVLSGITTLNEVWRATKGQDDIFDPGKTG
jgi:general secretion pathway protein E